MGLGRNGQVEQGRRRLPGPAQCERPGLQTADLFRRSSKAGGCIRATTWSRWWRPHEAQARLVDQGLQELLERDKAVFAEHQAEFVGAVARM